MKTQPAKIVIVVTSHDTLGKTGEKTGYNLEELAVPYLEFKKSGAQVIIASPLGGTPPCDPKSAKTESPAIQEFLEDPEAHRQLDKSVALAELDPDIDVLFFTGGHGPMFDLAESPQAADLIEQVWRDGGIVAALCHGPAALVNAQDLQGRPIVQGKRMTSFTNAEEQAIGLATEMPFLLETRLRKLGARFECAAPFIGHAVRDGRLVTGQNPASAKAVAQLCLRDIELRAPGETLGESVAEMQSVDAAEEEVLRVAEGAEPDAELPPELVNDPRAVKDEGEMSTTTPAARKSAAGKSGGVKTSPGKRAHSKPPTEKKPLLDGKGKHDGKPHTPNAK